MIDLNVVAEGHGPVLLCLHGIGSSSASFRAQLDELSATHRVVAWDAPGYAKSPDPPGPLALGDYVRTAADLIADLGGEPVHLLGVSWGAVIACAVALEHPELLRSLILVDGSRGSGRDADASDAMRARAAELEAKGAADFAAARAPRLLSDEAHAELVEAVRQNMIDSIRLPGYAYAAESMAATDLTPRLAEIAVPTLVLVGDRDVVTGAPEAVALSEGIPDAVLVTVHGAGHVSNQECPQAVNAWLASHLQIIDHLYPLGKEHP